MAAFTNISRGKKNETVTKRTITTTPVQLSGNGSSGNISFLTTFNNLYPY